MNIEVAFGKVIRQMRKEKDISQEKLAFECGLDRTFISLIERGKRQPTLRTIQKISTYFAIKPSVIIEKTENMIKNETK